MPNIVEYARRYNYIQDYFRFAYETYISYYPAYPVNYYSLDRNEGVYDDEYLMAGSYEKFGVGELSGMVWNKIYSLPVYNITQITPNQESGEKGLTYSSSLNATLCIPQVYGLEPCQWDVLDINYGFDGIDRNQTKPLFTVNKIDLAHHGEYLKLYQLSIQVAPFGLEQLEQQISNYYKFYEPTQDIKPLTNVTMLYNILNRSEDLTDKINNCFYDNKTSLYLYKQNIS